MNAVIVDDHYLMRDFLHEFLERELGCTIVGEASDGESAVKMIRELLPDLVILDIRLPLLNGFEVVKRIVNGTGLPRILFLTGFCNSYTVFRTEHLPVHGLAEKAGGSIAQLKAAILSVASGRSFFCDTFKRLKEARRHDPLAFDKILSDRELEIIKMMGDELTDGEIAIGLKISVRTVETHRMNIGRKLGMGNRVDIVRYARSSGLTRA